jgi:transposase
MGNYQRHSSEFKEAIVSKIMNRGDSSVAEVCEREGVNQSTAYSWIKRDTIPLMENKTKSKKWSPKEKLRAVSETFATSESETGAYLRKAGLHSQQLDDWRSQVLTSLTPTAKTTAIKDPRDEKIKALERDILRKDKALAEASALLILQKKVNLIWGDEDQK